MLNKIIVLCAFLVCCFLYLVNTQTFRQSCLDAHNKYRRLHGVPNMSLDNVVQAYALEWAEHLARTGQFKHRTERIYGENILVRSGNISGANATKLWYDEIKDYDFNNPGFNPKTAHFTQVIWKKSVKLGCAAVKNGSRIYVVANYSPAGNVNGQYRENVPRLVA